MAVLIPLGLLLTFFGVGLWARRWSFVGSTLLLCVVIAAFLWLNDGWYGAGWGDFGVAYNAIAGGSVILGTMLGVAVGKANDRAQDV